DIAPHRRISSAFRNVPGGQLLGATNDYGLRLLDPGLADRPDATADPAAAPSRPRPASPDCPKWSITCGPRAWWPSPTGRANPPTTSPVGRCASRPAGRPGCR